MTNNTELQLVLVEKTKDKLQEVTELYLKLNDKLDLILDKIREKSLKSK